MPIIKCKCGRHTTFGLTCSFCRSSFQFSDEAPKDEAEFSEIESEESGFHIVEFDDEGKEILED